MKLSNLKIYSSVIVIALAFSLSAQAEPLHSIVIDGASGLAMAVQPSAAEFAKAKQIGVSVHNQGSKAALECLNKKTCQLGLVPEDALPKDSSDWTIVPFAISGLEIAVGKGAGVTNLTTQQLEDIFSGKAKNWKEVGGSDLALTAYKRRESSGLHKQLSSVVKISSDLPEIATSTAGINVFKKSPGAVTYINSGTASSPDYKSVKVNDVEPSLTTFKSGAYKLTIKYFIVGKKDVAADSNVKALTDFLVAERPKFFPEAGMLIP